MPSSAIRKVAAQAIDSPSCRRISERRKDSLCTTSLWSGDEGDIRGETMGLSGEVTMPIILRAPLPGDGSPRGRAVLIIIINALAPAGDGGRDKRCAHPLRGAAVLLPALPF